MGQVWAPPLFSNIGGHANWKTIYTNGSAVETELALGAAATVLQSAGTAAAPTFASIAAAAAVVTDETTSSTTYADLSTTGPTVTINVPGTSALVLLTTQTYRASGTGNTAYMSVDVSGASTVAASDANGGAVSEALAASYIPIARITLLTGLTPGSTVFKAQYRVDGSTYHFVNRGILVIPL